MNFNRSGKRNASDPLLPLRSPKQARKTFIRADGAKSSPSESETLGSRWKAAAKSVIDLTRETVSLVFQTPTRIRTRSPSVSPRSVSVQAGSPRRQRRNSSQTSASSNNNNQVQSFVVPNFNFVPQPTFASPSAVFQPSTTPLAVDSARKSRRPRTRRTMNPPATPLPPLPPPKFVFPSLPPSPSPTSSLFPGDGDTFKEGIPRKYKSRPHIFEDKHKINVKREQKLARDELLKQLYEIQKQHGYGSTLHEFTGLMSYRERLVRDQQRRARNTLSPSSSLVDLRALSMPPEQRLRRHSTPEVTTSFLQSALDKAKATLKEPKPPKPFAPSLEQLRLRELTKDDAIEQRLRPKRAPLPSLLPPKDEAAVDAFLRMNGVIATFAKQQVSDKDIRRLKPGQWLNDEVINFYGAMLLERAEGVGKENGQVNGKASGSKPLNAYYFPTFFWSKLERDGYEKGRLAKWTKKIDLFSKDVALIPVNHSNLHWTGAAINFRKKRIESYDSMNLNRSEVFKRLRAYLDAEHRNKKQKPFDFSGWEDYTLEDTPQQENDYDCGVFTCQFLESLSRGEDGFGFTQRDIPYLRRRMIWEIGKAKFWTES